MALQTKTINGSTSSSNWTYKIEVIENSIDDDNMTSNVTMNLYLGRAPGTATTYFAGTATNNYNCGGQTYSESLYHNEQNLQPGDYRLIGTHTFNVSNTGSPTTINISASMSTSNFTPNSASASGTMDLTEIIQGIFRLGVNGVWKQATPYLRVNGSWKKCKAYLRNSESWKKGV